MRAGVCLVLMIFLFCGRNSFGQDINISQTFAAPLLLNPGLTGGYQGNFRIALLYRDQWAGMIKDPYRSFMISGDARLSLGKYNQSGDHVGVGVLITSDKVNPFDYSTNSITFNGAYHKRLGKGKVNYLSAGLQLGLAQKNFTYENFTFQDQFNGIDDFPFRTREDLPANNFAYLDFSLGLNYSAEMSDHLTMEFGIGGFHLLEPNISFYQDVTITNENMNLVTDNSLKRRLTGHAAAYIRNGPDLSFTPRILYSIQGSFQQLLAGSGIRSMINEVKDLALHGGIWGRMTHDLDGYAFRDAIFMVGLEFQSVIFGFSYDLSIDDLTTYSAGQHTFEFSIRYIGNYEDEGYYCPQF